MIQLIKNEWLFFFRTRWLLSISFGFLILLILTVLLGTFQFHIHTENCENAQALLRNQWENIEAMNPHSAAHYGTYVFKPSNLLSSLDDGVNSVTGNVIRVEGHVQNEIVYSEASQMQSISRFGKLRSSLLLQYIIPVLLIFLSFHSVSSEKQSGRLKLLLLQGASPAQVIFFKTLAIWFYGLALLAFVIVVHTMLNLQRIHFDVIVRTLLFFGAYSLYYFVITGLTVYFSARWQNPTVALTSMLAIWIVWTIFLPGIFLSTIEKWYQLPSRNEMTTAMRQDRTQGIDGHNPADERRTALQNRVLAEYGVDSLSELPINFDGIVMQEDEEYGNKIWDRHFGDLRQVLSRQKQTFQLGGLLSPFISLHSASMGFAGNDNFHHQDFLIQVENYRRVFVKTLNDEHAFGGSKTGEWQWKADNDFFRSVPDFQFKPTPVFSILSNYMMDLILLLGWSILTLVLMMFGASKVKVL